MDRLQAMSVFVAVAEEGGFAAAARRLSMSPPSVTRSVASLEERIGTRLLHRTTRHIRLTEAGHRYFEDCRRILSEIEEAEQIAAGFHSEPKGQLSLTASVLFGRMHVAPILLDFLNRYPQVSARTLFVDRVVNLMEEGVDIAIRIAHLPDSGLTALRVGSVRRVVCAAPQYLREHGVPETPSDLARHRIIGFEGVSSGSEWPFPDGHSQKQVAVSPHLVTNTAELAIDAALAGHGITRVLSYMIAQYIAAGRLQIILEDFEPAPVPIHIVHHEGRQTSARVRAFVDFAADRLRKNTALNP